MKKNQACVGDGKNKAGMCGGGKNKAGMCGSGPNNHRSVGI